MRNPKAWLALENAKAEHRPIGRSYLWCDYWNGVGYLVISPTANWCDKCRKTLWSYHDPRPSPYMQKGNDLSNISRNFNDPEKTV